MSDQPLPSAPTINRVLLWALQAWGIREDDQTWSTLEADWRETLRKEWDRSPPLSPLAARKRILDELEAETKLDWSRVHPSWWIRALREEPLSIQLTAVRSAPLSLQGVIRSGLSLPDEDEAVPAWSEPSAQVAEVVRELWTKQIVVGHPNPEDPLVVQALTRLDLGDVTRLISALDHLKRSLAAPAEALNDGSTPSSTQSLRDAFKLRFEPLAEPLATLLADDPHRLGQGQEPPRGSLGLLSIARALKSVDPTRLRWTLQHLPYSVAKQVRGMWNSIATGGRDELDHWESALVAFALSHLQAEGRIKEIPRLEG